MEQNLITQISTSVDYLKTIRSGYEKNIMKDNWWYITTFTFNNKFASLYCPIANYVSGS